MEVQVYREADMEAISARQEDDWGVNADALQMMVSQYPAWTFRIDGRPVMILGVWKLWEGNWECWAIPSDDARGSGLAVVRATRRLLDEVATWKDVNRFTALSREDKVEYNRWLEMLGFDVEYTQRKAYDNRLDVIGYRRLVA